MKMRLKTAALLVLCAWMPLKSKADLLGVNPSFPQINFVRTDPTSVSYDPGTQLFTVSSLPVNIVSSSSDSGTFILGNRSLQISFKTDGNFVSGTNGFTLTGQFTQVSNGVTNQYNGTLLQGNVIAFGYVGADINSVAQFDFRIQLTGGQIMSLFDCANNFAISMTSQASSFTGSFTNAFNGSAEGLCGPEDTIPPTITCPPVSQVVTTPATDPSNPTNQGFIITYPSPTVTDNCDPSPTLFCDTPSGSFVALNPGDSLTVNCYGIDVSGNFSSCSFTVIMGTPSANCIAFTDSGCAPVTLPNDPGICSATYTFSLPIATNCSGQTFVTSATAMTEAGGTIVLTNLGNGTVQGQFPRTLTTNGNIITFTANDGAGDSVVRQCRVFVQDTEPPTIACMDQTATFKPILTNALSCNEADFDNTRIAASNFLWFSSVIRSTPMGNTNPFTVHIFDQTIQLCVDNTNITLDVPEAYVIFTNGLSTTSTIFTNGHWVTYTGIKLSGSTFASGLAWQVPFDLNSLIGNCWGRDADGPFRRHVKSATWCARFAVDNPGIALSWQWGAVVETNLNTNCTALCIKPVDDSVSSSWRNSDPAGTCENFKAFLVAGARGKGWALMKGVRLADCTGILSNPKRCNLGKGIICEGVVDFKTPTAADNCDSSVTVTCTPPPGSLLGPGDYTIVCTAMDSSGNSNHCTFTLTVLPPVQVIFDSPACDNIADNIAEPDSGFTDMNCPDDPSTPELVTCFHVGDKICHVVRLLDCDGDDVTTNLASSVTVHIDVTERQGTYASSTLVSDVTQSGSVGSPGAIMTPINGTFQYVMDTSGYQAGTVGTSTFFRACVWAEYNSSPGVPVGMEDVILQSQ
jgi:hypothetical protein